MAASSSVTDDDFGVVDVSDDSDVVVVSPPKRAQSSSQRSSTSPMEERGMLALSSVLSKRRSLPAGNTWLEKIQTYYFEAPARDAVVVLAAFLNDMSQYWDKSSAIYLRQLIEREGKTRNLRSERDEVTMAAELYVAAISLNIARPDPRNRTIQVLLADAKRVGVDRSVLRERVARLYRDTNAVEGFYAAIDEVLEDNVRRQLQLPDDESAVRPSLNAEEIPSNDKELLEGRDSAQHDFTAILQWIVSNARTIWSETTVDNATEILRGTTKYTRDFAASLDRELSRQLADASNQWTDVNDQLERVAADIRRNRANLRTIDAAREAHIIPQSGKRSQRESSLSSSSSSSPSLSTENPDEVWQYASRMLRANKLAELNNFRDAVTVALNEQLLRRRLLYDRLAWPELRSVELTSVRDIGKLLNDVHDVQVLYIDVEDARQSAKSARATKRRTETELATQASTSRDPSVVVESNLFADTVYASIISAEAEAVAVVTAYEHMHDLQQSERKLTADLQAKVDENTRQHLDLEGVFFTRDTIDTYLATRNHIMRAYNSYINRVPEYIEQLDRRYSYLASTHEELQRLQAETLIDANTYSRLAAEYKDQSAELDRQLRAVRIAADNDRQSFEERIKDLEALKKQREDVKVKVKDDADASAAVDKELEDLQQALKDLREENADNIRSNNALFAKVAEYLRRIELHDELFTRVSTVNADLEAAQARLQLLNTTPPPQYIVDDDATAEQQAVAELEARARDLSEAGARWKKTAFDIKARYEQAENARKDLAEQLANAEREISNKVFELSEARSNAAKNDDELKKEKKKLDDNKKMVKTLDEQKTKFEALKTNAETDNTSLKEQIANLNRQLTESRDAVARLQKTAVETAQQFEERRRAFVKRNDERTKLLNDQIAALNGTNAEQTQTIEGLRASIVQKDAQLAAGLAAGAAIQATVNALTIERDNFSSTAQRLQDERTRLQKQVDDFAAERRRLETTIAELQGQVTASTRRVAEQDQELLRVRQDLTLARRNVTELARERDSLTMQLEAARTASSANVDDLRDQHTLIIEDLRSRLAQYQVRLEQAQNDRNTIAADRDRLTGQITALQAQIDESQREITTLTEQNAKYIDEIKELRAKIEELEALNDDTGEEKQRELEEALAKSEEYARRLTEEKERSRKVLERIASLEADSVRADKEITDAAEIETRATEFLTKHKERTAPPPAATPAEVLTTLRELSSLNKLAVPSQVVVNKAPQVVLFDITAERAKYQAITEQLGILDNSRAYDAMENYIMTSSDIDSSVFVVLDAFSHFVNTVEGATNSRRGSFWVSDKRKHTKIIRDIIEAASEETEHHHVLELTDIPNLENDVFTLIESVLRSQYLESASERPDLLFEPVPTYASATRSRPMSTFSTHSRTRIGAAPTRLPHKRIFDAHELTRKTYDFSDALRMYVLPVLNQPSKNMEFTMTTPTGDDPWTIFDEGSHLTDVARTLTTNLLQRLHVRQVGKRIRRPTTLSVRKFLSDLILSETTSRFLHAAIRYQDVNRKLFGILDSIVANGFLSAFTYCLKKVGVPKDFKSEYMYSALNNEDFSELVAFYYNFTVASTQASRSTLATDTAARRVSDKFDFFLSPNNRIQPMPIPRPNEVYTPGVAQSRYGYITQLTSSDRADYRAHRRRIQAVWAGGNASSGTPSVLF